MYKNVICVGTIWDLDDVAYPELDDYSAMSRWNYYQVMKYQLSSSRKEMKNVVKLDEKTVSLDEFNKLMSE